MIIDEKHPKHNILVRMRKAVANPQLFMDRIEEINIGDTIVGYLFEDEYFEGVVTDKPDIGAMPILELKIKGDDNVANRIWLASSKRSYSLTIYDSTRNMEFDVGLLGQIDYHSVEEIDPSKRIVLEGNLVPAIDEIYGSKKKQLNPQERKSKLNHSKM